MELQLEINTLSQVPEAARKILLFAGEGRLFLFYGAMGAGKTTFIKALCAELGVSDTTNSPTFSIVNEYRAAGKLIYHFDFYRIKDEAEAYDLGYEEYFYGGNYCFIEWPEKISGILPEQAIRIQLEVKGTGSRYIRVTRQA